MHKELAFKGRVQNVELLIFTSTELPLRYWSKFRILLFFFFLHMLILALFFTQLSFIILKQAKLLDNHSAGFHSKYYLWGVFREKQAAPLNSHSSSGVTEIPLMKRCDNRSPISPLSNSATSGSKVVA